ncbi:unnamed protein product [Ambrosiozyma monospora]|uniref:Unnamed protein product n=1 Tax=Ambrosiozyma monospora TaxID=43982 RepID=A0ACB5TCV4_AMBMO|nr:unnamed protein product [Ambrosiozyma monospora]
MFSKFKGLGTEFKSTITAVAPSREEKDGKTDDDTVVNRALVKYYKDKEEPFPEWLPVKDSLRNFNKKLSSLSLSQQQEAYNQQQQQQQPNDGQYRPRISNQQQQQNNGYQPQQQQQQHHQGSVHRAPTKHGHQTSRFGTASPQGGQTTNGRPAGSTVVGSKFRPRLPANTKFAPAGTAHSRPGAGGAAGQGARPAVGGSRFAFKK